MGYPDTGIHHENSSSSSPSFFNPSNPISAASGPAGYPGGNNYAACNSHGLHPPHSSITQPPTAYLYPTDQDRTYLSYKTFFDDEREEQYGPDSSEDENIPIRSPEQLSDGRELAVVPPHLAKGASPTALGHPTGSNDAYYGPTHRPNHYVPQQGAEGAQPQRPTVRRVIKTGGNHNKKGTQKTGGVKAFLSSALPEEIITGDNINEGDKQETEGVSLDRDCNIVE